MRHRDILVLLCILTLSLGAVAQQLTAVDLTGSGDSSGGSLNTMPPVFSNLQANGEFVPGQVVTITFSVSKTLTANPTVMVNGNAADFGDESGGVYTYTYTVLPDDPEDIFIIEVSGADGLGNLGYGRIARYPLTTATRGDGAITLIPSGGIYDEGAVVTVSADPSPGWRFHHWEGSLVGSTNPATVTMDSHKAVAAVFSRVFELSVSVQGSGTVALDPPGGTYDDGTVVVVTANASPGWRFDHWEGALGGTTSPATITMDSDDAAIAVFVRLNVLSVSVQGDGVVTLDPPGGAYDAGTVVTLIANPSPGQVFSHWEQALTGSANPATVTMSSDKVVTAVFIVYISPTCTLGTSAQGSGVIATDLPGGVYVRGATATVTATASPGWRFHHWTGALDGSTNSPATLLMDTDKVVVAVFVAIHTLDVSVQGEGAVALDPDDGSYHQFTSVTLTATASPGWRFDHWEGALDGATNNPVTLAMDSDKVVTAVFTEVPQLSLSILVIGDGQITLDPDGGWYDVGAVVTVRAVPGPNARFERWEGALKGDGNPSQVTMDANKGVTAVFAGGSGGVLGGGRKSALEAIRMDIREEVLPLDTVSPTGRLAMRLTGVEPVDVESIRAWAECEGNTINGGAWRPTTPGDDIDGWVIFTPDEPLPAGIVRMTVEAVTITGKAIGPISREFLVAAEGADNLYDRAPFLVEVTSTEPLPGILAAPVPPVYLMGPVGVFDEAVVVQVPVPEGIDPAELGVYYFSESALHRGWYPAERVSGWMLPGSLGVVEEEGQTYLRLEVNHSGVIQLGRSIPVNVGSALSFDMGAEGSYTRWILFTASVLGLAVILTGYWRKSRRHPDILVLLCILTLPLSITAFSAHAAPTVSNVSFVQQASGSGGTEVLITYDLSSPEGPCDITVSLSKDGGIDGYAHAAPSISGDIFDVTTGTGNQVVWDIAADHPNEDISNARLRVTACLVDVIYVNEFLCSNDTTLADEEGKFRDWIEIYNNSAQTFNLAGMTLTDDCEDPDKWVFPVDPLSVVPSGGYLIVFASGRDVVTTYHHTNFKLNRNDEPEELGKDNDMVFSAPANGTDGLYVAINRFLKYPLQETDYSLGLHVPALGRPDIDQGFCYFDEPTPGAINTVTGNVYSFLVNDIEFSHASGFYDTSAPDPAVLLSISTEVPGATIYYTTDGSEPSLAKTEYTGPIDITASTPIRASAFPAPGAPLPIPKSFINTATYLVDVPATQRGLPAISLVAEHGETFFNPNGINAVVGGNWNGSATFWVENIEFDMANAWNWESGAYNHMVESIDPTNPRDYERPTYAALIYPDAIKPSETAGFEVDCGIRIHGSAFHRERYQYSEDPADWNVPLGTDEDLGVVYGCYDKISFRLYFRGEYGPTRLEPEDQLFEDIRDNPADEKANSFNKIVLRGGQVDSVNPFYYDELARRLFIDMGGAAVRGRIVNLFINGRFYSYYNMVERPEEDFYQQWFQSDADWDVVQDPRTGNNGGLRDGTMDAINALYAAIGADLTDSGNYTAVTNLLDIDSFIDYLLLELYVANEDWPDTNWLTMRERPTTGVTPQTNGKIKFSVWDAEAAFRKDNLSRTALGYYFPFAWPWFFNKQGINDPSNDELAAMYMALKVNSDFCQRFSERAHYHFIYNVPGSGALSATNVIARDTELKNDMLTTAIAGDLITYVGDTWAPNRISTLITALSNETPHALWVE